MKNLVGILTLLLIHVSLYGNDTLVHQKGLKVMSKSGLKLRLSPSTDAPVLDIIDYGEEVFQTEDFVSSRQEIFVNWVEGSWIKVQYQNQEGFVFDGFVSELVVPSQADELASSIEDLGYAMYNYVWNHFEFKGMDTLAQTNNSMTTNTKMGRHTLFMHETPSLTQLELTFEDVRIMDVYHLLESMMDTRSARSRLKENTIFFQGGDGKVNKLKIGDGQILLKKLDSTHIKVSIKTLHQGC
ncbi:SH3 domain-containing protein [Portibacter marinus]|uniref:SH3 domain-containing protein n=1 Tax=Portibacter marinus TaxID=2898660 RepID=UPI001F42721E|nr:SH3 domain-containing protein [Portibacter marinus]